MAKTIQIFQQQGNPINVDFPDSDPTDDDIHDLVVSEGFEPTEVKVLPYAKAQPTAQPKLMDTAQRAEKEKAMAYYKGQIKPPMNIEEGEYAEGLKRYQEMTGEPIDRKTIDIGDVATATGIGGAVAAATPYVARAAGAALTAYPPTAALGATVSALGAAAPLAQKAWMVGEGLMAGGISEFASQLYEMATGTTSGRIAAGMIPGALGTKAMTMLKDRIVNAPDEVMKRFSATVGKEVTAMPEMLGMIKASHKTDYDATKLAIAELEKTTLADKDKRIADTIKGFAVRRQQTNEVIKELEKKISVTEQTKPLLAKAIGNPAKSEEQLGEEIMAPLIASKEKLSEDMIKKSELLRQPIREQIAQNIDEGVQIDSTPAYQSLKRELEKKLNVGEAGIAELRRTGQFNIRDETARNQLNAIYDALQPKSVTIGKPTIDMELAQMGYSVEKPAEEISGLASYEALDQIRRKLGKVAFGKGNVPVEGYDAIGQQEAVNLYRKISQIQKEYVGEGLQNALLEAQSGIKGELNEYTGKIGKVINLEKFTEDFAIDPKNIPAKIYFSKDSLSKALSLAGQGNEEILLKAGRDYVARKLEGKSSEQAGKFFKDNKEVIKILGLESKEIPYRNALKTAEILATATKAERRQAVAQYAKQSPAMEQKTIQKIEKETGEKLSEETAKMLADVDANYAKYIKSNTPYKAIAPLFIGKDPKASLDFLANRVIKTPEGRRAFANSIYEMDYDKVKTAWKSLGPALRDSGLLPKEEFLLLNNKILDEIKRDTEESQHTVKSLLKAAITLKFPAMARIGRAAIAPLRGQRGAIGKEPIEAKPTNLEK